MPRLTVETTVTHEVTLVPQLKKKLKTALDTYADLKLQRDAIEHAMQKNKDTIGKVMDEVGESSLKIDGYTTTIVSQVRKKLDPKLLITLGVTQEVLEKATVETPTKPYVKVTVPGGKDDE